MSDTTTLTEEHKRAAEGNDDYLTALAQARTNHLTAKSGSGQIIKDATLAAKGAKMDVLKSFTSMFTQATMSAFDYRNPMALVKAGIQLTGAGINGIMGIQKMIQAEMILGDKEKYVAALNSEDTVKAVGDMFLPKAYHERYSRETGWEPPKPPGA